MKNNCLFSGLLIFLLLLGGSCSQPEAVRFGICTDVHNDVMHDAEERLRLFVDDMNDRGVDFIIQLGDFTQPQAYNVNFLNVWNAFEGPAYHVLGNHDMDNDTGSAYSREYASSFLGMPEQYYSFDLKGYHFIVLDGNENKDPPQSGYPRYIGTDQTDWLKEDLSLTGSPVIVFSHQSLEDADGVENAQEIRKVLEEAKHESGEKKVIACFSGHHHIDYSTTINGIHYTQINSMSYFWLGGDYLQVRYGEEIDENYPYIKYTAPYKDPLFAVVEIDSRGIIRITGRESTWVGPDPWELGYPENHTEIIAPRITGRELEF